MAYIAFCTQKIEFLTYLHLSMFLGLKNPLLKMLTFWAAEYYFLINQFL